MLIRRGIVAAMVTISLAQARAATDLAIGPNAVVPAGAPMPASHLPGAQAACDHLGICGAICPSGGSFFVADFAYDKANDRFAVIDVTSPDGIFWLDAASCQIGDYGSFAAGAVPHFIAVFVSTTADSYVVCDPMHLGGAVVMTQGELQAFFQSPVSVYDTTIRLVAWEGASEEEEEVEVEEEIPEVEVDPYAMALDVTAHHVTFDEGVTADDYETPYPGTGFNLSGHEFWQKWSGGKNPTYLFGEGSDYGKRCMVASAKRFEAMMSDPPQAIQDLKSGSNWGGSFFNWNDDYALSDWGDGTSARLWAWKTGLIKWISQTNRDGSCYLPTLEMVETLAGVCLERAAEAVGEIVGCKAP